MERPRLTKKQLDLWWKRAEIAKVDLWTFFKYFVFTSDPHDKRILYKPLAPKVYLRVMCRAAKEFPILWVEKSRQIMMSWFWVGTSLHDVMFNFSQLVFLQSKKQEDANKLIDRARHIYEAIKGIVEPELGRSWAPDARMVGPKYGTNAELEFPDMKSLLQAIPQGPDVVRMNTCSRIFADEMNEQPEFGEGYAAAMPTITGGGFYDAVGTPKGKTFAYYVIHGLDDRTERSLGPHIIDTRTMDKKLIKAPEKMAKATARQWIENQILAMPDDEFRDVPFHELVACLPGMEYRKTAAKANILTIHYSADPDKDPCTELGAQWVEEARADILSESKWRREYEIDYNAYAGRPVISNWSRERFVKKLHYVPGLTLRSSYDFGNRVNVGFFAQYGPPILPDGKLGDGIQLRILRELVLRNSHTVQQGLLAKSIIENEFSQAWLERDMLAYCDPNGARRNETTSDKSMNTSVAVMESYGIYPDNRGFGVPESTQLMETVFYLTLPCGQPAILIDESCEYLISCLSGGLHYPENPRPGRDGYYEKDDEFDHGGDTLRYLIANCFNEYDLTGNKQESRILSRGIYDSVSGRLKGHKTIVVGGPNLRRGEHRVHSL